MEDFKDLRVWVKAHELALAVYRKTRAFPKEEMYGLTSQLRLGVGRREYCGRMRSTIRRRNETVSSNRTRLCQRSGMPFASREGFGFLEPRESQRLGSESAGNSAHARVTRTESESASFS